MFIMNDQIWKAKADDARNPDNNPKDWAVVYDCNLHALVAPMTLEYFIYDIIANPYWTVVPDFVEGDEIVDSTPGTDLDTTPFEKNSLWYP